ncbi:23S rRNA (uracil(1939)-C(5))-methyltransferase RlmD [Hutsoniella sourekii]
MARNTHPTEILEVTVQGLDDKGNGWAHYRHPSEKGPYGRKLKLTLPSTLPGEKVRVTVPNARGRKRATVHYDELLETSPDRMKVIDNPQDHPGGTPLEIMSYSAQLQLKENLVKHYLAEQGFDENLVEPIIGMEDPLHYRNKMEFTFGSNYALGMHKQGNFRQIVDLEESLIATPEMMAIKKIVSQWQRDWQLPHYNKEDRSGLLRHLMLRQSFATGELMVALFATRTKHDDVATDLKNRLLESFDQLASLLWIKNEDIADRTQADEVEVLYGRDYILDELYGYRYRIWFDTFFQPNPKQAHRMVDLALDLAQVERDQRVLDLFCGVGTFSLPFAGRCQELAGIEIVETSIESAKRNARDNGLDNTYFLARDARKGMVEVQEEWGQPDLLLLDPPRSGAGGKVMRRIGRLATDKVIYISCNPKTLAEDLIWLREFGYELQVAYPVDQFPMTMHVETVTLLVKER